MTSWVTPPTFVPNTFPAAAEFNKLRDDLNFFHERKSVKLYLSSGDTHSSGTINGIAWDSESWDPLSMHSGSSTDIIIPSGYDGIWDVLFQAVWASNATGEREAFVKFNGTRIGHSGTRAFADGRDTFIQCIASHPISAGEAIVAEMYQNAGTDVSTGSGPSSMFVVATWRSE